MSRQQSYGLKDNGYIYGQHAVESILNHPNHQVKTLFLSESRSSNKLAHILPLAENRSIPIKKLTPQELTQLVQSSHHQGIVAEVIYGQLNYTPKQLIESIQQSTEPCLILILDEVQDPHNLGACLRTALGAHSAAVVIPKNNSVKLTPTVRKVACGAAELVPLIEVTNLVRYIKELQAVGVWCYGLSAEAEHSIYQADLTGHVAIVLGSEGSGLRQSTQQHCDQLLSIPINPALESLNVSVACGISLFEVMRQKRTS